jgi:Asp-tRNA(Asn)/Glu-tRNA(Gln) amidotransferase A subunit family amidase
MPPDALNDLLAIPARHLPARIAAGETTAEAVTAAYLDRIAAIEPGIRAWVRHVPEQALAEARLRDRGPAGAMRGVPVAVKDVIDTHDLPTAYGSAVYPADNQPPRDAAAVALVRAAGAVVLGKTVTTEFAAVDPGPTQHPSRPGTTPGGSSSGSAAAVAAGMAPLAFGTQTAGSTIRPAAFCGIAGFKPTFGLLDRTGVKTLADSLDTLGLLARDVRDLAFFAAVLRDDPAWAVSDGSPPPPRLAVFRTSEWHRAETASQHAVEGAAEAAAQAGATLVELADPDDFAALLAAHDVVMRWEVPRALAYERLTHLDRLRPKTRGYAQPQPPATASEHLAALTTAAVARVRWNMALRGLGIDAILTPAAPGEAPAGLASTGDAVFNRVWTLLYLPCVAVPAGIGPGGLPVAVQLVGPWGEDARTLAAAAFVEDALARSKM